MSYADPRKLKMTSNEDLMKFLLNMEDKRAKEREADRLEMKQLRERERIEDMEEILKVIDNCIGEKVGKAIGPLSERTEAVEDNHLELKGQVDTVIKELRLLKEKILNEGVSSNEKTMAEVISKTVGGQYHEGVKGATEHVIGGGVQEDEYHKAVSLSRRTVGLQPIDAFDLKRQRKEQYGGAQTEQEERVLAVREFLNLETKLDSRTIDEMEIERIFAPAKGDKECLYVTFKQESSVNKIF